MAWLPQTTLIAYARHQLMTCQLSRGSSRRTGPSVPPPPLDAEAQTAFIAKSMKLAPQYKTELLPPPGRG